MGNIKIRSIRNTAFFLFLFLSISAFAQENRGIKLHSKRLALVIGNSAYQASPLKNTVNDAEDMSDSLKKLGFKVILKKNADQRNMEDAIRNFGKQLKDGSVGLFYFAGHGMQVEGRNYLIPIDAQIESESDVKYEAVDAGRVLGKMEDAENQLNIVILDACRNNPIARSFRTEHRGLARMDAPTGSFIAYSTAPGGVAADGLERNGIFTKHLIKHMKTPGLPIEQVLKRVRIDVSNETNGRQIPWESSSLMGDFYFNFEKIAEEKKPTNINSTSDDQKTTLVAIPRTKEKFEKIAEEKKPTNINSTSDDQKTTLAAIPRTKEKIERSDTRQKLAIFPIYRSNFMHAGHVQNPQIKPLRKVLSTNNLFIPTYSYYDIGDNIGIKKIENSIIDDSIIDDLWIKNSTHSGRSPNIDLVCRLGLILEVDFVLMYSFIWDNSGLVWNTHVYLIDVIKRESYSKSDYFYYGSLHQDIIGFTEKFFYAYERDNLK